MLFFIFLVTKNYFFSYVMLGVNVESILELFHAILNTLKLYILIFTRFL